MKACVKCGEVKALELFSRDAKRDDGRQNVCKACVSVRMKAYTAKISAERGDEIKAKALAYRKANKESLAAQKREYIAKNLAAHKARRRAWYEKNKELVLAERMIRYYTEPEVRQRNIRCAKESMQRRPEERNARVMAYRAKKLKRTPPWADMSRIRVIYKVAAKMRLMGYPVQVDHVYPLRGETVSGLHVHNNLMIVPAEYNHRKGRKVFDPDGPEVIEAGQEPAVMLCTSNFSLY